MAKLAKLLIREEGTEEEHVKALLHGLKPAKATELR